MKQSRDNDGYVDDNNDCAIGVHTNNHTNGQTVDLQMNRLSTV